MAIATAGGVMQDDQVFQSPGIGGLLAIETLADGTFAAVGGKDDKKDSGQDAWLLRLGPSLETLNSHAFERVGADGAADLAVVDDGFLLAGAVTSADGDGDAWLMRVEADGQTVAWETTFGDTAHEGFPRLVALDDGWLLAGATTAADGASDGLVVRLGSDFDLRWGHAYGGADWDWIHAATPVDDGFLFVGGTSESKLGQRAFGNTNCGDAGACADFAIEDCSSPPECFEVVCSLGQCATIPYEDKTCR